MTHEIHIGLVKMVGETSRIAAPPATAEPVSFKASLDELVKTPMSASTAPPHNGAEPRVAAFESEPEVAAHAGVSVVEGTSTTANPPALKALAGTKTSPAPESAESQEQTRVAKPVLSRVSTKGDAPANVQPAAKSAIRERSEVVSAAAKEGYRREAQGDKKAAEESAPITHAHHQDRAVEPLTPVQVAHAAPAPPASAHSAELPKPVETAQPPANEVPAILPAFVHVAHAATVVTHPGVVVQTVEVAQSFAHDAEVISNATLPAPRATLAAAVPAHGAAVPQTNEPAPAAPVRHSGDDALNPIKKTTPSTTKALAIPGVRAETQRETRSVLSVGGKAASAPHESFQQAAVTVLHAQAQATGATPFVPQLTAVPVAVSAASPLPSALRGELAQHPDAAHMTEAGPGIGEPKMLVASANVLEVGISGGSHGWLRVRAELGHTGEVTASLMASSAGSATALTKELGAMSEYLRSESVGVTSLAVTAPERHSAMQGAATYSGSAGDGSHGSGREAGRDAQGSVNAQSVSKVWDGIGPLSGPIDAGLVSSGGLSGASSGGWLSVRV